MLKFFMQKVNRKFLLLILIIPLWKTSPSQSVSTLMGARGAGMGYTSATLRDEWALLNNVGGLSGSKQSHAAFAYEIRPGLIGANRTAAVFTLPLVIGVAGVGLFRFGDDLYNEQIISAGYGNQLGIASLGIKINYIQYHADGFGNRRAVSLNFGGIAQITPEFSVGAYIVNINQPRISTIDKERLPTRLVVGFNFKPAQTIILATEIEKDLEYNATVKAGMEYQIYKKTWLRTGFNFHPNAAFFGIGFSMRKIKIDYALQYPVTLGAVHQASASYRLEPPKKNREKL